MARNHNLNSSQLRWRAIRQIDVPRGREGKHREIIDQLLRHLDQLKPGNALKVALAALPCTKAQIRAALSRASRKRGLPVATSSDATSLYLWKTSSKS